MKKITALILTVALVCCFAASLASCGSDKIIVDTNAYFAPFEYYNSKGEIVGVDVEIMKLVGEKLGKEVEFKNTDFSVIIDNVSSGKLYDAGAAGITITAARQEKVDFSNPYYTSVQYVIMKVDSDLETREANGVEYIVWEALAGKRLGTQLDTTGWIYTDGEINATEDNDYGYAGTLYGTNTTHTAYDSAQLAADAVKAGQCDVVIIDELPAQFITEKNSGFKCVPLYYAGETEAEDEPVIEQYAICVTKGNEELLAAINEVLAELLVEDANGITKIEKMVMAHMGME